MTGTDTPLGGIHFVGGWYDFFLRQMLNDYAKAKSSGRGMSWSQSRVLFAALGDVRLTVGKFAHWQLFKYVPLYTHAVVSFYDHYFEARGRRPVERDDAYPVTLEIVGVLCEARLSSLYPDTES